MRREPVPKYKYFYLLLIARDQTENWSWRVGPFKHECDARRVARRHTETHEYDISSRNYFLNPPKYGWERIPRNWS